MNRYGEDVYSYDSKVLQFSEWGPEYDYLHLVLNWGPNRLRFRKTPLVRRSEKEEGVPVQVSGTGYWSR